MFFNEAQMLVFGLVFWLFWFGDDLLDLIKKSKRDFIRHSKNWVEELVKITDGCAGNIVYKYNRLAVRWLRWVGANFLKEIEINGEPFYQFIIINNNNLEEEEY